MPEILSDFARRVGEAFMEASRCEHPEQAARLRQKAYRLVDLIRERELMLTEENKK